MIYEVGVTYTICGFIEVDAASESEAFETVNKKIENLSDKDVQCKIYMPGTLKADKEYVEESFMNFIQEKNK